MSKYISTILLFFLPFSAMAQERMKPLEELINKSEPASIWLGQWISNAKNKVEVLPCDTINAKEALYNAQVTTRSPMGAIIYTTGGLLIDNGWIRILGSGSSKLKRSLPGWNKGKSFKEFGEKPGFLLIADDAVGGFFAINGGALGQDTGTVYYLSPDNLDWEPLWPTYSQFLEFCFSGHLNDFYKPLRWKDWAIDIKTLDGDQVFQFTPRRWAKERKNIANATKVIVPVEEQYESDMYYRGHLGLDK